MPLPDMQFPQFKTPSSPVNVPMRDCHTPVYLRLLYSCLQRVATRTYFAANSIINVNNSSSTYKKL